MRPRTSLVADPAVIILTVFSYIQWKGTATYTKAIALFPSFTANTKLQQRCIVYVKSGFRTMMTEETTVF